MYMMPEDLHDIWNEIEIFEEQNEQINNKDDNKDDNNNVLVNITEDENTEKLHIFNDIIIPESPEHSYFDLEDFFKEKETGFYNDYTRTNSYLSNDSAYLDQEDSHSSPTLSLIDTFEDFENQQNFEHITWLTEHLNPSTETHIKNLDSIPLQQNVMIKNQLFENITVHENSTETFMLRSSSHEDVTEKAKRIFDIHQFKALYDAKLKETEMQQDVSDIDVPSTPNEEENNISSKKELGIKKVSKSEKKTYRRKNKRKIREQPNRCYHLWDFLRDILSKKIHPDSKCVEWVCEKTMEFRITNTRVMANLWGQVKQSKTMTYDKMSRAIRYYCSLDILKKVEGKRLQFQFSSGRMWTKNTIDEDL